MLFSYFEEAHIDEGFKQNLAFHFVYSDGQFDSESVLADHFDDFCLIFEFLALIFDFGSSR